MKAISLKFNNDQYNLIKTDADFLGINITTYMRQAVLNRAMDAKDYSDAIKAEKADHEQTVSREQIMERLGME